MSCSVTKFSDQPALTDGSLFTEHFVGHRGRKTVYQFPQTYFFYRLVVQSFIFNHFLLYLF